MAYFEDSLIVFEKCNQALNKLEILAVELGLPLEDSNLSSVTLKLETVVREFQRAEETAQGLGYPSLKVALEALAGFNRKM